MLQLCTNPEATLKTINTFLGKKNFLDPDTGKEFTHKCIPSQCLPEVSADMVGFLDGVTEEWLEARTRIMNSWNARLNPKKVESAENKEIVAVQWAGLEPDKVNEITTTGQPSEAVKRKFGNMAANAEEMLRQAQNPRQSAPPITPSTFKSPSCAETTTQQFKQSMKESEELLALSRHHVAIQQQQTLQMRLAQINNYSQMQAAAAMQRSIVQQGNAVAFGQATQSWGVW
jgi:hypothetical protein